MTELEKLVEKDAIRDQYYVYARALDRIDNPLGKTVFAEDAQVDYGPTYKGTGYGFIDMMLKMHRKMVSTHHVMTNILIKLNEDGTKAAAEAKGEPPFFVVCDELEDPHNLGAILRTAETAGVHGVVIPKRRSAGLTSAVYKASAGAVEYVPVARVSNITDALREMKKRGVWVYGLDMDGETWCSVDMKGAAAVVVGSEGRGISRLVKEQCDFIVSLPMRGHITSLNASVACGIVLYEAARQRQGLAAK